MWVNRERRRTFQTWADMKSRCYNQRCHNFPNYGARGIAVCDRWRTSFANFLADMGEKPDGLTLDRLNTNGNYEPTNCRWANRAEQRRNRRDCILIEHDGKVQTAEQWSRELGWSHDVVRRRYRRGLPISQVLAALTTQQEEG